MAARHEEDATEVLERESIVRWKVVRDGEFVLHDRTAWQRKNRRDLLAAQARK